MSGNSNPDSGQVLGACGVCETMTRAGKLALPEKSGHAPIRTAGGLDPAYSCEEAQAGSQWTRLAARPYQIEVTP